MNAKEYLVLVVNTVSRYGFRDVDEFKSAATLAQNTGSEPSIIGTREDAANRVKALIARGLNKYVPGAIYFDPIVAVEYATLTAHDDFGTPAPAAKPIVKGSIVKARCGWYRVSAVIAGTVNLASVFGGKIWFKRVPLAECVEDEAAWYANWQQSETYQSM
jgi:hypothetical protein